MSFDELEELEEQISKVKIEKPIVKETTTTKVTIEEKPKEEITTRNKSEIINEAKLVSNNLDNIENELDKELSKLSKLEKELDNSKEEKEEINEVRKNLDQKPIETEIQETKDLINDLNEEEEDKEDKKPFEKTDFDKNLHKIDIKEDIELIFNKVKFEWNNFELLIKRTKNIKFQSYNIVITKNGMYIISFLEIYDELKAFNVIELIRRQFEEFNYNYSEPLILKLEAKGFVDIIRIVKDKAKQNENSTIGFKIEQRMPNRFLIECINSIGKVGFSIPFTMIENEKVSKLIQILINELG
jgi:hypothetical protein